MQPLPLGITPHKLRHTFASILVAIGKDPTYVMQQLGHTGPGLHPSRLLARDAPQRG
jgi:integrase